MEKDIKKIYECPECHLKYKYKKWEEKCEVWCRENQSCNLDIIEHAEKSENDY